MDLMMKKVSADDFMSFELLGAIVNEMARLREFMQRAFGNREELAQVNLNAGIATVALPSLINALERNLDRLAHGGFGAGQMQPTMTWYGETNDKRRLDFSDVNRWIESIDIINRVVRGILDAAVVTRNGAFCGNDRTRQKIRRARL